MKERMKAVIDEVKKVNADIVCFQEVKTPMLKEILQIDYVRDNYIVTDITGETLGSYGVVCKKYILSK